MRYGMCNFQPEKRSGSTGGTDGTGVGYGFGIGDGKGIFNDSRSFNETGTSFSDEDHATRCIVPVSGTSNGSTFGDGIGCGSGSVNGFGEYCDEISHE